MTEDKYCKDCKHWHKTGDGLQGDCDKIAKGTRFETKYENVFYYDGYSYADEIYDDIFHCFEPRKKERIDKVIKQLEKLQKETPGQKIIIETKNGTMSCCLGDAIIYKGVDGKIVIDAEKEDKT